MAISVYKIWNFPVRTFWSPAEIMDFTPGEDSLLIEYAPGADTPEVDVQPDAEDTGLYHVTLDGTEVALVHSPGGFGMADVALVPRGAL